MCLCAGSFYARAASKTFPLLFDLSCTQEKKCVFVSTG